MATKNETIKTLEYNIADESLNDRYRAYCKRRLERINALTESQFEWECKKMALSSLENERIRLLDELYGLGLDRHYDQGNGALRFPKDEYEFESKELLAFYKASIEYLDVRIRQLSN